MTHYITLYNNTPTAPHVLAAARLIEEQHRTDRSDVVVEIRPLALLQFCPPEIERQVYAARQKPVFFNVGEAYLKIWRDHYEVVAITLTGAAIELAWHNAPGPEAFVRAWSRVFNPEGGFRTRAIKRGEYEAALEEAFEFKLLVIVAKTEKGGQADA